MRKRHHKPLVARINGVNIRFLELAVFKKVQKVQKYSRYVYLYFFGCNIRPRHAGVSVLCKDKIYQTM